MTNQNLKNKKVLIIGPSGSGKTFISLELRKQNINAIDADLVSGLSGWFDKSGKKVKYLEDADKDFLDNHEFFWDRKFLKKFLIKHKNIYLFGLAGNIFNMIDLFDKIFFLNVSNKIIVKNLRHESRRNPMGKTEYQLENALRYAKEIKNKAKKHDIVFIDCTNKSPLQIFDEIDK